jgi:peptidoglycan/xylan/chitin deacetylase (PgdA/CDA1 family)
MQRRKFIQSTALGAMAFGLGCTTRPERTHVLSLSFDDGFKKSTYRTVEIHEEHGLKACINVMALGHLGSTNPEPEHMPPQLRGDFDDWNALVQRGHEIMPHSLDHKNLAEMPFEEAKADIDACLEYFEQHLEGYRSEDAVYNFAYNASTPELDAYALTKVMAVRTGGRGVLGNGTSVNPMPTPQGPFRLGCWSYGPDNADRWVEEEVNVFLTGTGGWLILNLHGLDDEGWGPVSTTYLDALLRRLVKIAHLDVLPVGMALKGI